jgi:hypothetical protein
MHNQRRRMKNCNQNISTIHHQPEQHFAFSVPNPSGDSFEQLGLSLIDRIRHGAERTIERHFKSHFGIDPQLVSIVWQELNSSGWLHFAGRKPNSEHLLWCLFFLKNYCVEEINASRFGACERTLREKAWLYAEGIANLDRKFVRAFL